VAEDDGLSFAPVLEVDLGAVFRRDRARRFSSAVFRGECGHAFASFSCAGPSIRAPDLVSRFPNISLYRCVGLSTSPPGYGLPRTPLPDTWVNTTFASLRPQRASRDLPPTQGRSLLLPPNHPGLP
jgi:hypothetical protein